MFGTLIVESGGTAIGVTQVYGSMTVSSGGLAIGTNGELTIERRGVASATQGAELDYGSSVSALIVGASVVESGGVALAATVSSGGEQLVSSDGTVSGTQVLSGGLEVVSSGATAHSVVVSSGGTIDLSFVVSSGQTVAVGPAQVQQATSFGGVALRSGATANLDDATVLSGGVLSLGSGAILSSVTVSAGALLDGVGVIGNSNGGSFDDFGVVSGVTIGGEYIGGSLAVQSGGTADGVTFDDGSLLVSSGGVASGAVLAANARAEISAGGISLDARLGVPGAYDFAIQDVYGSASGTELFSEATERVYDGGVATAALAFAGGSQTISSGGLAKATTISSGGEQTVSSGGSAVGTVVSSGGGLGVFAGGGLSGASVLSGGELVLDAGSATDTTVSSGGELLVFSATISSGQTFVERTSVVSTTVLDGVTVSSGGRIELEFPFVLSGGTLSLASGTEVSDPVVLSGGVLSLVSGAEVNNVTISAGGRLAGDGEIFGVPSPGIFGDLDYGVISGVQVGGLDGAANLNVLSGGRAVGADLVSGEMLIQSGATMFGGEVAPAGSGSAYLFVGGLAEGVSLYGGAAASMFATSQAVIAGVGRNLALHDGAWVQVLAGGVVSGTSLQTDTAGTPRAQLDVYGSASGSVVSKGGFQLILSGGVARRTVVSSGGAEEVGSGGTAISSLVLSGGRESLDEGATGTGVVVSEGGRLAVDQSAMAKGAVVSSGGELEMNLAVSPGQTLRLPPSSITHQTAGHGITLESGSLMAIGTATVSSGGTLSGRGEAVIDYLTVSSGGRATALTIDSGAADFLVAGAQESDVTVASGGTLLLSGGVVSSGTTLVMGPVSSATAISGVALASGAILTVDGQTVLSGGALVVADGSDARNVTVAAGGRLVDDGVVTIGYPTFSATLSGTLSGSGTLALDPGSLQLSDNGAAFSGQVAISDGDLLLTTRNALGTGAVEFVPFSIDTGEETLEIGSSATPASGTTFRNALDDFDSQYDSVYLEGLTYVFGASATVKGDVLTVTDGGTVVRFKLGGTRAGAYQVMDGASLGLLVRPVEVGQPLTEAIAAFDGAPALAGSPASAASLGGAGHLLSGLIPSGLGSGFAPR